MFLLYMNSQLIYCVRVLSVCSRINSSNLDDWMAETRLVDDFTQSTEEMLPRRSELDCFTAR